MDFLTLKLLAPGADAYRTGSLPQARAAQALLEEILGRI